MIKLVMDYHKEDEYHLVKVTNNFASGIRGDYKSMPEYGERNFSPDGFFPIQQIISKEEVI